MDPGVVRFPPPEDRLDYAKSIKWTVILQNLDTASDAFEEALERGEPVSIEQQLQVTPDELRGSLFPDILTIEVEFRMAHGDPPSIDEYLVRFPDHHDDIRKVFQEADHLPDGPVPGLDAAMDPHAEAVGSVIGPYKLREVIGEGGMGVVYVAEQQVPVGRQVALKLIKPGMDTKEVIARFESERQALALMDHLHIAHVLDAGATDMGRPYFVMELSFLRDL